ncbi:hypothetical protein D3C87_83540 [compost metagenome]
MSKEKPNKPDSKSGKNEKKFPGYPSYPADEDIYRTDKEEKEIDPEDITRQKTANESSIDKNLDVPGSELDDEQEETGNEDEENNYYSLGGDKD